MSTDVKQLRCSIYTRKSSEEGLDQAFNSLDAQREACEAYILSQASLGWKMLPDFYDDGGISGGTMERPALQRLLADIQQRKVDVVVVYKIDRLTRSLADFSKIVEIFDAHGVSFVSITQQFNTTTSMGRLTLNILLSFAQFEREVTAERIRDKVAASKKKGMWMGGNVPLGYQIVDRKLAVDKKEAETVRWLFTRYLELGSIKELVSDAQGADLYRSEQRARVHVAFGRGNLHHLLTNPVYIGKTRHKQAVYDGEHDGIIEGDVFARVQALLKAQGPSRRSSSSRPGTHLLGGLLHDTVDQPFLLVQAQNHGRRYRYYVSRPDGVGSEASWRLAAAMIEPVVERQMHTLLNDRPQLSRWIEDRLASEDTERFLIQAEALSERYQCTENVEEKHRILRGIFRRISIRPGEITYTIDAGSLIGAVSGTTETGAGRTLQASHSDQVISIIVPIEIKRRGVESRITLPGIRDQAAQRDPVLIGMVARAHLYLEALTDGSGADRSQIATRFDVDPADISRALPLAFLSPKLIEAIVEGRQPFDLCVAKVTRDLDLPLIWEEQQALLAS